MIVQTSASFEPIKYKNLLVVGWINSVSVIHSKHENILTHLARFITTLKQVYSSARWAKPRSLRDRAPANLSDRSRCSAIGKSQRSTKKTLILEDFINSKKH